MIALKHLAVALIASQSLVLLPGANADEKPLALRKAIEARSTQRLMTARIEFSLTEKDVPGPRPIYTQFFTWQCAQNDYILVHREDDEGVFKRYPSGKPAIPFLNKPEHFLVKDGQVWDLIEGTADAYVRSEDQRQPFGVYDLRTMGLNPVGLDWDFDQRAQELGYPEVKYQDDVVDGLHVVTGVTRDSMVKWWIDPEKDWSVVRTEVFQNQKKIGEWQFEVDLDAQDGIWFPHKAKHYRLAAGDTEPSTTVELHSTEFNRAEHPLELTVADIGIEVGTSVTFQDRQPVTHGYWAGEKAVPFAELVERIESGELTMGPSVERTRAFLRKAYPTEEKLVAAMKQARSGGAAPESQPADALPDLKSIRFEFETEWETYTRQFIARYQLDEEQQQKAWIVCAGCEQRARAYVASRRTDFETLDRRIQESKQDASPENAAARSKLKAKRQELMRPIDRIFEERLKPRLDRLPTRRQREAVEGPPARP